MDRQEFVEGPLQEVIKAATPDIEKLTYIPQGRHQVEQVEVTYSSGYKRYVCIDADSLGAIIRDVASHHVMG